MKNSGKSKLTSFLARHKWLSVFFTIVVYVLFYVSVFNAPPRQAVDRKAANETVEILRKEQLKWELASEQNLSLSPHVPIIEIPQENPHVDYEPKPAGYFPPPNGMIDYSAPHEVKLPDQFNVDVALTRSPPKAIPTAPRTIAEKKALGLSAGDPVTSQAINVTHLMNVELSSLDPGAFEVKEIDAKPKQLPLNGHAEWHWVVTPNEAGEKHLRLHWQSIRIFRDGALAPPEDLGTAFATITVTVEPFHKRVIPESEKFLSENWKKILGYFLPGSGFVLLAWAVAKVRGKKAPSLIPKEPEERKEEESKDEDAD